MGQSPLEGIKRCSDKRIEETEKRQIAKKVLPTGESQQDLFLRIWRIYPQTTRYTGVSKVNPVLVSAINLLSNAPFPLQKPSVFKALRVLSVIPTRCWVSYSNGFCFRNMMPCSFDYFIYPYYPAYTMGCYQIVISHDNGRETYYLFCWFATVTISQKMGKYNYVFCLLEMRFLPPISKK